MGNDHSHLNGIKIDEKAVEVSDFWSHHSANVTNLENTTHLSVFISELFIDGPLWRSQTPLEKNSKHLMIYRHPSIVRYISSWQQGSKFHLATEDVTPLSHLLATQDNLQVCIGLQAILKALCFLHEKAHVSHNNICTAAIYVTKDGGWKLGGMEYACKFAHLNVDYLTKAKSNRYNKAIDSNEEKNMLNSSRKDLVDVYAFATLVHEVLKDKNFDEIPLLGTFRDFCREQLQHINVVERPKLVLLLEHEFFNHEFIVIHSFLIELPLKSDEDKTEFFHNLVERLKSFSEVTVAKQFTNLLLSRMVLLNKTAQEEVLPYVLCPKDAPTDTTSGRLFTTATFRHHLTPKLLEIFRVRDAQIRLLLLHHFPSFIHTLTPHELQSAILPELLVGVKDTNDALVAATLGALAALVPLLGAGVVIGGRRARLFTDGRPVAPVAVVGARGAPLERPRPDGEEGEAPEGAEPELDSWEDWGGVAEAAEVRRRSLPDIDELDIKNQASAGAGGDDIDFFQDMEPVIEAAAKFVVGATSSKLDVSGGGEEGEEGWGDEEWE